MYTSACFPQSCQKCAWSNFWGFANIISERWYPSVVLICIYEWSWAPFHTLTTFGMLFSVNCLCFVHFSIWFLIFSVFEYTDIFILVSVLLFWTLRFLIPRDYLPLIAYQDSIIIMSAQLSHVCFVYWLPQR